ncbi:MAG: hypothetical protein IJI54_05940 [Kiritimatiellae bacterium]|nr:hypothetical protein [Kiritimatiellia bacterium]
MRKPSEYLPAAVRGLRSRLMPDCSMLLCHAGRSATVTRVGSLSIGEDAMTDANVAEGVRVLASASDFPEVAKGRLVSLDGEWRVVTGAKTDPAGATLSLSMSAPLSATKAAYRRPGTTIAQTLDVLAIESASPGPSVSDVAAALYATWYVAIPEDGWMEPTAPQIGDTLELSPSAEARPPRRDSLCVSAASRRDGFWFLTCRERD